VGLLSQQSNVSTPIRFVTNRRLLYPPSSSRSPLAVSSVSKAVICFGGDTGYPSSIQLIFMNDLGDVLSLSAPILSAGEYWCPCMQVVKATYPTPCAVLAIACQSLFSLLKLLRQLRIFTCVGHVVLTRRYCSKD